MIGCGYGFESMEIITEVIRQMENLVWDEKKWKTRALRLLPLMETSSKL
jgi:hypothetical protein